MKEVFTWRSAAICLIALLRFLPSSTTASATAGTTKLVLDGNRIYARLKLLRPDGTWREALAFVDLGSPSMVVSESLFKELHVSETDAALTLRIGSFPVPVDRRAVTAEAWLPFPIAGNRQVEALLPAGVLEKYQVILDYGQQTLTVAQAGTLRNQGTAVPLRINEKTGLITVDARIAAQNYALTIDCGSAYTWISKTAAGPWLAAYPDWERGTGAVGLSNMRMADDGIEVGGTLLRIPEIQLGGLALEKVGALAIGPSRTNWDFMTWYSQKNAGPVVGWLGGNVLRAFRITLDYRNRTGYWLRQKELDAHDLDQVGLTLRALKGEYFVSAIVTQKGHPIVEGIEVGDRLLRIGAVETKTLTPSEILSALHGKPGETRRLTLERGGKPFTVENRVAVF